MIRQFCFVLAATLVIASAVDAKQVSLPTTVKANKMPYSTTATANHDVKTVSLTQPKSFHDLVVARKFTKAEKLTKKTLSDAKRLKTGDPRIEQTYEDVAQCYIGLQKFDDARPYFLNVLQIEEKKNGPNSPKLLPPLNDVVRATCAGGACYDTIPYLQRMLSIRKKTDPNSSDIPINLLLIGEAYEKKEKFESALDYFRQAVLAENRRAPGSPMSQALERNIDRVQRKLASRTQRVD